LEGFKVDLKTFLGLAMPNQCCQTNAAKLLKNKNEADFWVMVLD